MPGCSLILADIGWQMFKFMKENLPIPPEMLLTQAILICAMLIGLVWLIKKPGVFPILYLILFQLFRLSGFISQALDRLVHDQLSNVDVMYYILYLICWMYIAPFLLWLVALKNQDHDSQYKAPIRPNLDKLLHINNKLK